MKNTQSASQKGKVYLVGAGPGDPGLITLRGKFLLERAEAVVYDHLANVKLLAHAPAEAELIYVGKKSNQHTLPQEGINRLLVELGLAGKRVVRLKGGDPFIFGRGAEEIEELVKAGIPFEVVPGVTSATAAATYAGIPITHRDYTASVAFVTGHEADGKEESNIAWDKLATGAGTIIIYMGIKNLPLISQKLIENGRSPDTPVAVVRWASTPQQRSVVGTLATISEVVAQAKITPPALVIVGEVVKLRGIIDWYEHRPLFGKRIAVTRTREQASELVSKLEEYGAECLEYPTIHIEPVADCSIIDAALENMAAYHWLLFTSLNAVTYFFKRLHEKGLDSRALAPCKIGAVGKTTADEIGKYGLRADMIPEKFTGEGLAEALIAAGEAQGKRFLLPRALKAMETLPELLEDAGGSVTVAPVYQNVPPQGRKDELRKRLLERGIDVVTFASSSAVTNFLDMVDAQDEAELHQLLDPVKIAVIGPVTAETVRKRGLKVDIQPERYTIDDLAAAIAAQGRLG
ncbi:uroporphyrinogen-III C-methyltransferase [Candidatus Electronema sp. JM]|uniref:uroporphyrinogen-III C-methyltransferase n=1 Tax=Candidatus Electronema sp. JM TaxID=3401571 RepID=UPI003AA9811E